MPFSCFLLLFVIFYSWVMTMNIHKSAEDYLEAMLMLKEERGYVRSIDVADKLGVTPENSP